MLGGRWDVWADVSGASIMRDAVGNRVSRGPGFAIHNVRFESLSMWHGGAIGTTEKKTTNGLISPESPIVFASDSIGTRGELLDRRVSIAARTLATWKAVPDCGYTRVLCEDRHALRNPGGR